MTVKKKLLKLSESTSLNLSAVSHLFCFHTFVIGKVLIPSSYGTKTARLDNAMHLYRSLDTPLSRGWQQSGKNWVIIKKKRNESPWKESVRVYLCPAVVFTAPFGPGGRYFVSLRAVMCTAEMTIKLDSTRLDLIAKTRMRQGSSWMKHTAQMLTPTETRKATKRVSCELWSITVLCSFIKTPAYYYIMLSGLRWNVKTWFDWISPNSMVMSSD